MPEWKPSAADVTWQLAWSFLTFLQFSQPRRHVGSCNLQGALLVGISYRYVVMLDVDLNSGAYFSWLQSGVLSCCYCSKREPVAISITVAVRNFPSVLFGSQLILLLWARCCLRLNMMAQLSRHL